MYRDYEISSPLEALNRISDVLRWNGWTLETEAMADQTSYQKTFIRTESPYIDGYLTVAKKDGLVIMLRTMAGLPVFDGQKAYTRKTGSYNLSPYFHGIVMTAATDYVHNEAQELEDDEGNLELVNRSDAWFNQPGILKNTDGVAFGVGIPFPCGTIVRADELENEIEEETDRLKLYIHYCTNPTISLTVTLRQGYKEKVKQGDYYDSNLQSDVINRYQYCHMSFCVVDKVGRWDGGVILSGTFNSDTMVADSSIFEKITDDNVINKNSEYNGILLNGYFSEDCYNYALFRYSKNYDNKANMLYSMSSVPTTFCMVGVDNAVNRVPTIWASVGDVEDKHYTGKRLCTTIGAVEYKDKMPEVPHYAYLLSEDSTDYGRNSNILNNVTVDLPIAIYALRDPDVLGNYSHIGYVSNIFAISLRNIQCGNTYEVSYPGSGIWHRVFSHSMRQGKYGYDGIAVAMEQDTKEATDAIAADKDRIKNVIRVINTFSAPADRFYYNEKYIVFNGVLKLQLKYSYDFVEVDEESYYESENISLKEFKSIENVEVT